MASKSQSSLWWTYILECADSSLYTGSAKDLQKRLTIHNSGKGAKYTRSRLPVKFVYFESHTDRSTACKREAQIKQLSRDQKQELIKNFEFEQL